MLSSKRISLLLLICFLCFHLIFADKQVVISCGGDEGERAKGDAGAPGKRGPAGPPGPLGPKGNAAAVDNITREVETLKQLVEDLQRQIRAIPGVTLFYLQNFTFYRSISRQFDHLSTPINMML